MMCSCDQLRKLVAQVRPVGRMSLEPCEVKMNLSDSIIIIIFFQDFYRYDMSLSWILFAMIIVY